MPIRVIWTMLLLLFLPAAAGAQELRVYLVTVGPGELSYERYGHNALLFVDPEAEGGLAFDWGRFDFDQPNFVGRFIKGDMLYSSGVGDGQRTLAFYVESGRRVELQRLNLTEDQAWELLEQCEVATRPENKDYRYDYFIGNCSTKIRDVLDETLDGQIRSQLEPIAVDTTWRREAERHVLDHWPLWFGFYVGLGRPSDAKINAWDQGFLPAALRDWLGTVEVTGSDGQAAPLVIGREVLSEGSRPPVPESPPSRWWQMGLLGLALAAGLMLLSRLKWQLPARLAAGLWYFVAGFVGTFLLGVWAVSGHWGAYANQNILLGSPLGLPLALMVVAGRWPRASAILAAGHLAICVAGVALHFVPGWGQNNLAAIMLALPLNIAAAWVAWVAWNRPGNWPASGASNAAEGEALRPVVS